MEANVALRLFSKIKTYLLQYLELFSGLLSCSGMVISVVAQGIG